MSRCCEACELNEGSPIPEEDLLAGLKWKGAPSYYQANEKYKLQKENREHKQYIQVTPGTSRISASKDAIFYEQRLFPRDQYTAQFLRISTIIGGQIRMSD